MEVQGKILEVFPAKSGVSQKSGKEWMTQDYLLEVPSMGQYTKKMTFNVFGAENIRNFNIQKGEEVIVQFDIDAREYNGRWYNEVRAYNIGRPQAQPQQTMTRNIPKQPVPPTPPLFDESDNGGNNDDLPF